MESKNKSIESSLSMEMLKSEELQRLILSEHKDLDKLLDRYEKFRNTHQLGQLKFENYLQSTIETISGEEDLSNMQNNVTESILKNNIINQSLNNDNHDLFSMLSILSTSELLEKVSLDFKQRFEMNTNE